MPHLQGLDVSRADAAVRVMVLQWSARALPMSETAAVGGGEESGGRCLASRDNEKAIGCEGERAPREGERGLAGLSLTVDHQTHLVLKNPIPSFDPTRLFALAQLNVRHSWQHTRLPAIQSSSNAQID